MTATTDDEEVEIFWKMYVPAAPTTCSVNLINAGLVVNGTQATVEFRAAGAATGFSCRVDNGAFETCEFMCIHIKQKVKLIQLKTVWNWL